VFKRITSIVGLHRIGPKKTNQFLLNWTSEILKLDFACLVCLVN